MTTNNDEIIHECQRLYKDHSLIICISQYGKRTLRAERSDGRFVEVKLTDNDLEFGLAYISNALLEPALKALKAMPAYHARQGFAFGGI